MHVVFSSKNGRPEDIETSLPDAPTRIVTADGRRVTGRATAIRDGAISILLDRQEAEKLSAEIADIRSKTSKRLDEAARAAGAFVGAVAARSAEAFTLTLLGAQDQPLVGRLSDLLGDDGRVRLEFALPQIDNKAKVSEVRDLASRPRSRSILRDAPAI